MKKTLLFATLFSGVMAANATKHIITISGTSFTPATVNAHVNDTVIWVISGSHTATEVTSATWAVNGTTPKSGGFDFDETSSMALNSWIKLTTTDTRYYVCVPHASMGMKGQINVAAATSVQDLNTEVSLSVYPNPANLVLNLNVSGADNTTASLEVYNLLGNKVIDLGGKQNLSNGVKKIDISALPRGIYFLNIVADHRTKSIRFVKE